MGEGGGQGDRGGGGRVEEEGEGGGGGAGANSLFGLENTASLPSKSPKIPLCRNSNEQTARLGYKIRPFCPSKSLEKAPAGSW